MSEDEAGQGEGGSLQRAASGGSTTRPSRSDSGRRIPVPAGLVAIGEYLGRLGRRYAPTRGIERVESRLLSELDTRMQRARAAERGGDAQRTFFVPIHEPPARVLDELLDMAARQGVDEAREYLYTALLRELVPDEVCMLAALAQGRARAVMHIGAVGRFGGEEQRVMSNLTDFGDAEGVKLRGMVGHYLAHLLALGLLEEHDPTRETRAAQSALQLTATATSVVRRIRAQGLRPRFHFGSVALSQLGRELWDFCRPADGMDAAETSSAP